MDRIKCIPGIGVLLTGLFLLVVLILDYGQIFNLSLAPVFLLVVFSVYCGGLRYGLVSIVLVIAVEAYLLIPAQLGRFFIICLTLLGTVWLVALLQRKAQIVDSINGNITALLEVMYALQDALEDWDMIKREELRKRIRRITNRIVDLTTNVKGWHDLKKEMEETQRIARQEASSHRK